MLWQCEDNMAKTWIIELEEDPDNGDLFLPLPPKLLEELGWTPLTKLDMKINDLGEICLTKS